jgi:WD40 repeat protein
LAIGSSDGMLQILDAARGETIARLDHEGNSVFCAAWDPNGRYLLTGAIDARLRVWLPDGDGFTLDQVIPAHTFTINALAFHPEGRWFATGSRDRTIKLWDADTIGLAKVLDRPRFEGHQHSVNALLWHPFQNLLISGSDDRSIKLWQMEMDAESALP